MTPRSEYLAAPLGVIAMSGTSFPLPARDDLLGYIVRNEAGTNDGTIVPFEPPDTLPGRQTRFLPAVVAITSSQSAQYRTELTLGWSSRLTIHRRRLELFRDVPGRVTARGHFLSRSGRGRPCPSMTSARGWPETASL